MVERVIDELGKMELLSERFVDLMPRVFPAPNPILGTILLRSHPIADRYRKASGVEILHVEARNREALPSQLAGRLHGSGRDAGRGGSKG